MKAAPYTPARSGWALARRALPFVSPHRRTMAGVVALALAVAALGAVEPLAVKYVFDALASSRGPRDLALGVVALTLADLGRVAATGWLGVKSWDLRLGVDYTVRRLLVDKLNALPLAYHQGQTVGATVNRMNSGITGTVVAVADVALNLLPAAAFLVLSVAAMLRLDWRLSAAVLVLVPIPAAIAAWAAREQTERERGLLERWNRVYGRYNEVLASILTVKGFGREREERDRYLAGVAEGNEVVRRGALRDGLTGGARSLVATLARVVTVAYGGWLVTRGEIGVGTLLAFLGYVSALFGPVQGLTTAYATVRRAAVSLEIIFGILDEEDEVGDRPGARDPGRVRGDVRFQGVTFGYQPGRPVLHDVDLHVRPGETVALVGPSGAGKTTLVSLLQRHYVATSGAVVVDGTDVRDYTQAGLRASVAAVFQDIHLFDDTVAANIAYGLPHASRADVERAAKAARAHDFITALPRGYDTPIGERGGRLSGGQRQSLAIARALLLDPAILILDEATSALDPERERLVQEGLRALTRRRTTLVIAHRLATIAGADRVVVLRSGRVAAVGTHAELLLSDEFYRSIVDGAPDFAAVAAPPARLTLLEVEEIPRAGEAAAERPVVRLSVG